MSRELLPCPHCGERDELYPAYRSMAHDGKLADAPYAIDCLGCGSDFTPRAGIDAIEAWNRRAPAGWRVITEDDLPPKDVPVLMGCWESFPRDEWTVELGLYGSTKGGWIHGRMTHWAPADFLFEAPPPALQTDPTSATKPGDRA